MVKVIYHTESATKIEANEIACSVSNEKEKALPNTAAMNPFGLQKVHDEA